MLWSLIKILVFVAVIVGLTLGISTLLETSGGVQISVMETEFTLSPLMAIVALGVLLFGFWVALKVIGLLVAVFHFLNGDETAVSRYFDRNRERKGFEALADGLMALASGEGRTAMTKAAKADKYLNRPELTDLITAQAAEIAGDTRKAEEVYKRLLTDERTRFVGVRGIMKQKLAQGDTDTALKLAEKAFALKPKHEDTQDVLLRLQAGAQNWTDARNTLGAKLRYGALPKDVYRRRDAVLALSEATDILADGKSIEARESAIEANKLSPDLVPAAAMAARSYIEAGKHRYATRVLKKAWEASPHPDLAAAFAEIAPDEKPAERIKRFATLTKLTPDHPEAKMLLAELNIAAEDFPAARRALGDLAETAPSARTYAILAAVERGEGADDAVVRGWLAKALTAPRGPQWVCDNCKSVHPNWAPVCSKCEAFDTLAWKEAPDSELNLPAGAEMLPLIVGGTQEQAETEPEDIDVTPPVVDHEVIVEDAEEVAAADSK
ncbi:MAG: heme biosynthesis protein HemY [Paracoccaceae bacterium]